jgi:hypothetical protein
VSDDPVLLVVRLDSVLEELAQPANAGSVNAATAAAPSRRKRLRSNGAPSLAVGGCGAIGVAYGLVALVTRPHDGYLGAYRRHFADPRRERGFLSSVGFTTTFVIVRGITHSIKAGIGPFHNMSTGGRHLHHCTFGIFGLLGLGYLWTYQIAVGVHPGSRAASRFAATTYGIAGALTLDEFALWFDLQDDYWTKAGRKSIDAVTIFGGLLTMGVAGRGLLRELVKAPEEALHEAEKHEHHREPTGAPVA